MKQNLTFPAIMVVIAAGPTSLPGESTGTQRLPEAVVVQEATVSSPEVAVVKPARLKVTDEAVQGLKAPEGFRIQKFAEDLENPRMMAVAGDGTVYVTSRKGGEVIMLRDTDGDGKADKKQTVARKEHVHGIDLHDGKMYLVTVKEVYSADMKEDGTVGELRKVADGLPNAGQHPNRTLAVGPDGKLYVTVGSLSNAFPSPETTESATMLQMDKNGSNRRIFAEGLRNTIGFGWHPQTKELWGMDHGTDWLGSDVPPEELNRIEDGKHYGWPYVWGDRGIVPQTQSPKEGAKEEFIEKSQGPVLGYTAHAAPMQMAFYTGAQFPEEYRNDAFVAMRGSWNRTPPAGYEVVRIRFDDGKPAEIKPFVTGFLAELGDGKYGYLGRLAGVAVAKDGSLLFTDDENGTIYRVSYAGGDRAGAGE